MSKKCKVAILVPNIEWGGTERFISILANNLNLDLFDPYLIVTNSRLIGENQDSSYEYRAGLPIYSLRCSKAIYATFKVRKLIREIQPDIIFSTFSYFNLLVALWRFILPKSIKFIARETIVLDKMLDKHPNKFYAFLYRKIVKYCLPKLDVLICQSQDMKKALLNLGVVHPNYQVINNPINTEKILLGYQASTTKQVYDLVSVGRLFPQKGYDRFVKMIAHYKKHYNTNIKVAIIGNGPDEIAVAEQIEAEGLSENICLLGKQSNPFKFFQEAKLFVMTSYYEGFPNVLIEANACGLPAIAFNVPGGLDEIIEDGVNGFLVPDGDLATMAAKIDKGFRYPFNQNQIATMTKQRFDLKNIISHYENLLLTA